MRIDLFRPKKLDTSDDTPTRRATRPISSYDDGCFYTCQSPVSNRTLH